jgi:hypothetical protein
MDILVTPNGSARPEEVLALLGLGDLVEAGAVLERTRVELHEEQIALSSQRSEVSTDTCEEQVVDC